MRFPQFILLSGLIISDQITKWLARNNLPEPIEIIPNMFWLKHTQNDGIAFSLPFPRVSLIILTTLIIGVIIYFLLKNKINKWEHYAMLLVLGGAIGNLIDRIFISTVTDFLSFWSFPIFNLADTFITIGVGIFIIGEFFTKKENEEN